MMDIFCFGLAGTTIIHDGLPVRGVIFQPLESPIDKMFFSMQYDGAIGTISPDETGRAYFHETFASGLHENLCYYLIPAVECDDEQTAFVQTLADDCNFNVIGFQDAYDETVKYRDEHGGLPDMNDETEQPAESTGLQMNLADDDQDTVSFFDALAALMNGDDNQES